MELLRAQIRYQGVLHSIDPQAATISLEKGQSLLCALAPVQLTALRCALPCSVIKGAESTDPDPRYAHPAVRSLGTEGRKGNPAEEVPANDNVYEQVSHAYRPHTPSH